MNRPVDVKYAVLGAIAELALLVSGCEQGANTPGPSDAGAADTSYVDAAGLLDEALPLPGGAISDEPGSEESYIADF